MTNKLELLSKYIQAFGLLTTLKHDLKIDVEDPMAMAQELHAYLSPKDTLGTLDLGLVEYFGTSGDEQRRLVVIARCPADLPDLSLIGTIKFHLESGDTYEYTGIRVLKVESRPLRGGRMTYIFRYTSADSGTLDLGTFDRFEITDMNCLGSHFNLELARTKAGEVKDVKMSDVKVIIFSSTDGLTFRFKVDSIRYIHQRSNMVRVTFYGARML